ncbi:PP2C family protein-serine/threonine phosphatase, partial [Streptomyces flavofungini]|uniref:PP2C family protein-serine/threonine phosphatase n=1 Tax=Streptomyces flavofungini TaxID=68200 RepID=UPI0034DF9908
MESVDQEREAGGRQILADLLAASHLLPVERLPEVVAEHARAAGFTEAVIYLDDLQGRVLRLLAGGKPPPGAAPEKELRIDGTAPGRAYQYGSIISADPPGGEGSAWWVPILDGTERLGVLYAAAEHDDTRTQEDLNRLVSLLALIIVSKRRSSDTLARLSRTEPLNLAAEMQWNLMPPRTYADGRVMIAASMEPAYQISGDAYEYATDGPLVHLSIFDAMGHDTAAGLSAALALGACRNARRSDAGLIAKGEAVEKALIEQFDHHRYVTGILATLDTRTGMLSWVNRGHLRPIIIRGSRWSTHLDLYTDGITEARSPTGREFGLARFTDFIIRHHA